MEKVKEREEKSPPPSVTHARVRESKGEKFSSRRKFSVVRERVGERETGRGNSSCDGNYFCRERGSDKSMQTIYKHPRIPLFSSSNS